MRDDLANAFRAVKDEYDGESRDADLTLQRALFASRRQVRRRKVTQWVLLPIAAALVASTAWAGVTGRLVPTMHAIGEVFHTSEPLPPAPSLPPAEPTPPPPVAAAAPVAEPVAEPATPTAPAPEEVAPAPTPRGVGALKTSPEAEPLVPQTIGGEPKPEPKPEAKPAPIPDRDGQLFAEANRIHFVERDPQRALVAWDRYLQAAPSGALAPEARYNRTLTLVRLGRTAEAKAELERFAAGSYRREEARALLDAIARDAGAN